VPASGAPHAPGFGDGWEIESGAGIQACGKDFDAMSTTEAQSQSSAPTCHMPAEWEPHAATWLAWPHNHEDWPGKYQPIPWIYAEIIRHLARVETVHVIVNDATWERRARSVLKRAHVEMGNIEFHHLRTNRVWTRDFGAIFVRDRAKECEELVNDEVADGPDADLVALNWRFSGWAKYDDWQLDDAIAPEMAKIAHVRCVEPLFNGNRIVLEGGSIDVNGSGTLLTTKECLLSPDVQQRNPGLTHENLEQVFRDYLEIRNTIWLEKGIVGDDTHGHIDDIARFVAPDTVVAAVEHDPSDANYELLQANLKVLRDSTLENGAPLQVVELPMPASVWFRGQRLPASYANFYIANGLVLVPVFNDPNDRLALNVLADCFPDRKIVGIYSGDLVWGLGTLHCMTQQQPF
jgi:agmatine deiminase